MSSLKQSFPNVNLTKGFNQSGTIFRENEAAWREQFNFRTHHNRILQVPRKKILTQLVYHYDVLALVPLPVGSKRFASTVALTERYAIRLNKPSELSCGSVISGDFGPSIQHNRWGYTVAKNNLYFTRTGIPVQVTDGSKCAPVGSDVPSGMYLDTFFDHLVVGATTFQGYSDPNRIWWSHQKVFGDFRAKTFTEADTYGFMEHQRSDVPYRGITGMGRIRDTFYVHTPSAIFAMTYTGLPKVMKEDHVILDHGCGFPYGLITLGNVQYFPDINDGHIYAFDGQQITEVGDPVHFYLSENLNSDPALQAKTYGFADLNYHEVVWVFCSTASTGNYDRAVSFNYMDKSWYAMSVEDWLCFCPQSDATKACRDLVGNCGGSGAVDTLNACGDLSKGYQYFGRIFGGREGLIYQEEQPNDSLGDFIPAEEPYLTTNTKMYNSTQNTKTIESVTIHANYQNALGVEVSCNSPINLVTPTNFVAETELWTPNTPQARLSRPRVAGKGIGLRFKFKSIIVSEDVPIPSPVAPICYQDIPTTTYVVPGPVRYFSDSSFPPGTYIIKYVSGATRWSVGSNNYAINNPHGGAVLSDWCLNVIAGLQFFPLFNDVATRTVRTSVALVESNNAAAKAGQTFTHTGGKIGIFVMESLWGDNTEYALTFSLTTPTGPILVNQGVRGAIWGAHEENIQGIPSEKTRNTPER